MFKRLSEFLGCEKGESECEEYKVDAKRVPFEAWIGD